MRFVIFLCIPVSEGQQYVESVYEDLFHLRESWHFPKGHGSLCRLTDNDQWNVMREKGKNIPCEADNVCKSMPCTAGNVQHNHSVERKYQLSGKGPERVLKMSVTRTFSSEKAGSWMKALV